MKVNALIAALLAVGSMSAQAATLSVESMTVTGGAFNMGPTNLGVSGCVVGGFGAHQCFTAGGSIGDGTLGDNAIDADGLAGSALVQTLAAFTFFGGPVNNYFAHTAAGAADDPDPDAITATIDTVANTLTADFSGFYANWSGTNFAQGPQTITLASAAYPVPLPLAGGSSAIPGLATGVITGPTGNPNEYSYTLSWQSLITTDPFKGQIGNWNLQGTLVAAVPEPETYAMMLAGLGMLGMAARRRKAA